MLKPHGLAFALTPGLAAAALAAGPAHAVECRAASGETFTAAVAPAGARFGVSDCLVKAAAPAAAPSGAAASRAPAARPLSPLLQLYERPNAAVDVTLHGRRPVRPTARPTAPASATVTVPRQRFVVPRSMVPRGRRPAATEVRYAPAPAQGYRYAGTIYSVARAYNIDPAFMGAVIRRESGFNPTARSRAGARGFMQVMPGTAARFGVRGRAIDDPVANLAAGASYLKSLQRRYGNNLPLILSAYNAGEGAVDRHGRRIPPFRETQGYVTGILGDYGRVVARRSTLR
jgi:soluble lytic murein transglycosylase-like protein